MKSKIILSFFISLLFLIIFFLFTPRHSLFHVSAESFKPWSAASIFIQSGDFLSTSLGLFHYLFLSTLLLFPYNYAIFLEQFFSSFICYFAIFFLLKKYISTFLSFLFLIAWAPYFAQVESAKYLVGMSFLAIHYSFSEKNKISKNLIPPFLLISTFFNSGFIFFIVGHWFGILASLIKENKKISYIKDVIFNKYLYCSLFLIAFLIFSLFNQLNKSYNNHWVTEFKYLPIPIETISSFEFAFFQFGNHRYVQKNYPANEHYNKDWYLTHKKAFNDAQNFIEAVTTSKNTIIENINVTFKQGIMSATSLFFGLSFFSLNLNKILIIFSFLIINLGLISLFIRSFSNKEFLNLFSIIIGSSAFIFVFIFTNFTFRYYISLLPIALILIFSAVNIFKEIENYFVLKFNKLDIFKQFYYILFPIIIIIGTFLNDEIAYGKGGLNNHINYLTNEIKGDKVFYDSYSSINYLYSFNEVFKILNNKQKILTRENHWIITFSNVDPEKVDTFFILPPFKEEISKTENLLNQYDIIMVSNMFSKKFSSMATQEYLLYELHILPFLKKINLKEWEIIEIPYYGKIYKKRLLNNSN